VSHVSSVSNVTDVSCVTQVYRARLGCAPPYQKVYAEGRECMHKHTYYTHNMRQNRPAPYGRYNLRYGGERKMVEGNNI